MRLVTQGGAQSRTAMGAALVLSVLLGWPVAVAAPQASEQHLIKAAFVEKFTRFTQWPVQSSVNDPSKPFHLCVAGADPFAGALDELVRLTPIKGRRAVVRYGLAPTQIEPCNILIVTGANTAQLDAYLARARERAILTIGDAPGLAERGVVINFYQSADRVQFEINHRASREAGLVLSSRLLSLARLVGEVSP